MRSCMSRVTRHRSQRRSRVQVLILHLQNRRTSGNPQHSHVRIDGVAFGRSLAALENAALSSQFPAPSR